MKSHKKKTKKTIKKQNELPSSRTNAPVQPETKRTTKASKSAPGIAKAAPKAKNVAVRESKAPARKTSLAIPPILLEGDRPSVPISVPVLSGPGQRYALGPTPPEEHFLKAEDLGELPEGYGTERLFLAARDPHWLYASWDLTREQQQSYNSASVAGHLILRTYVNSLEERPLVEVHVHPESRSWFIYVGKGGTKYMAELGYRERDGKWRRISASRATVTPPETLSEDTSVQFATIPSEVSFEKLLELVTCVVAENVPLVEAIQQLRAQGYRELPPLPPASPKEWTPRQTKALAEVVTMDSVRRVWMGSLEITELIRRHLQQEISSAGAAQMSLPAQPGEAVSSISSPSGRPEQRKGFWFNVNAEIILYGATEPDARVSMGSREIKLRPDGTFSYRFALPDGRYDLPVKAVSADGSDGRSADLQFGRSTQYRGAVDAHPQDPNLKAPAPESVG